MKFAGAIAFLALAIHVVSEPTLTGREPTLVERDVATISNVINNINGKITDLDSAIKSFSGDPTPIKSASNTLVSAIESGTKEVSNTGSISATDALQLQPLTQSLITSLNTTVNALIAGKSAIVSAGQGGAVLEALQSQKSASQSLSDAITSKVPSSLQGIASQASSGTIDALQRGIDAFQGTESSSGSGSLTAANPSSTVTSEASSATAASYSGVTPKSSPTPAGTIGGPSLSMNATMTPSGYGGASTTSSNPSVFTGAAAVNGFSSSMGIFAVIAMVFAM